MSDFNFDEWAKEAKLKEATKECLKAKDFDEQEALELITLKDIDAMDITLGQKRLLEKAIINLKGGPTDTSNPTPNPTAAQKPAEKITTSTLAKESGLNALLRQFETDGQLDLLVNGAEVINPEKTSAHLPTDTATSSGSRIDNDPQVFLGPAKKAHSTSAQERL
ncbi:uncharacterized protein LOC110231286, partial [Exaiptasia diaphana]|uniref:Uncharacterized protein n=1 Tax=Exaiptasia diaphana TaxID=2652724 RepID=A0A913WP42_EXADI